MTIISYLMLFLVCLSLSCSTAQKTQSATWMFEEFLPISTVQVDSNFYVDRIETTNRDWKEYQCWVTDQFGEDSEEYQQTLLDTTIWLKMGEVCSGLISDYHSKWYFDEYPLVGVTYEQAQAYTRWKTERVAVVLLLHTGVFGKREARDCAEAFTIEDYLLGNYKGMAPDPRYGKVAVYSLPTVEDLARLTTFDELSYYPDTDSRCVSSDRFSKEECAFTGYRSIYKYNCVDTTDGNRIYAVFDNVEELTLDSTMVYGQGWPVFESELKPSEGLSLREPRTFVGFRNVCRFVTVEEYLTSLKSERK